MTESYIRQIHEDALDGRRLGRHVHHDPRSRAWPASTAPDIVSVKHAAQGLPLDQGQIGSCTANALCGALNSGPNTPALRHGPFTERGAVRLYKLETKLEGQPYPPNDPGGTGLMVCKAAQQFGWVKSYEHAFGITHALQALVLRPVIVGIDWYDGFDSPDSEGVVSISGSVRGGHEIVADEIDAAKQLVWFWNSWGASYGLGGRFGMSFSTLDQLLQSQGDVTVPLA